MALLEDAAADDVSFGWVLILLGLRGNPPDTLDPPAPTTVDAAFRTLSKLVDQDRVRVGRMEYIDGGPPGRVASVQHVSEPLSVVRDRVLAATEAGDWDYSCWVVSTT